MTGTVAGVRLGHQVTTVAALGRVRLRADPAGLVLGFDQQQRPATLRVYGSQTTRVVLVGGLRCAQLLALRAAGVGLRVLVRSSRAVAWGDFAQAVNAPVTLVSVAGPDAEFEEQPQQAVILDAALPAGELPSRAPASQVTILVHDELTTWSANTLSWADVVILQRLTEAEATVAEKSLGIADAADLSQLRGDVTAVLCQGSIHLVRLRPTTVELDLIRHPARRYLLDPYS